MTNGGLLISPARDYLRFSVECAWNCLVEVEEAGSVPHELKVLLPQCVKSQVLPNCPAQELQKVHSSQGIRERLVLDGQQAVSVNRCTQRRDMRCTSTLYAIGLYKHEKEFIEIKSIYKESYI